MSRLWAIFAALLDMACPAKQLALQGLGNQSRPCSRHVRPDGKQLGLGIDVIKLKLIG
jgi:hypothetical protein